MSLKETLRADLTTAIKSRDQVSAATLRMTLASISNQEVAGDAHRDLSDDEVLAVITKEAKKRREAAAAYDDAKRPELADGERAELAVLEGYLPEQLSDEDIDALVAKAVEQLGANNMSAMGAVMKIVQPQIAGRAEGGRVAAAVRRALA
ncbi:GatB/YqeY domain-containing protein [Branchiibius sp. NY16-3462-2]|uniref:GatB/YqeY domain-containing protein n=1 Tax=Branchiibius sp. NY16-3462-2 TaxID=1807500 RepID=UPI0007983A13|nr:GatB/YqeY domain-containing protein [Branchiibius sp. NY16-3462-2]KYH43604.1 glutamyl-tRNA amidotransferase [Branchiibius sp. NY16-3462-2]